MSKEFINYADIAIVQCSEKMKIKAKVFPIATELLEKTKSMTHNLHLPSNLPQILK